MLRKTTAISLKRVKNYITLIAMTESFRQKGHFAALMPLT